MLLPRLLTHVAHFVLWLTLLWAPLAEAQSFERPNLSPREIRDGLRLANDTTIALSTGPGVGGAFYRLKRSPFFNTIDSNQINLRVYLGSSLPFYAEEESDPASSQAEEGSGVEGSGVEGSASAGGPGVEESFDPMAFANSLATFGDPVPFPRWRPFLILNYGTATSTGDLPVRGIGRSEVEIDASSYLVGGGIRFDPCRYVSLLPTFSLSYNHVRGDAEGNGLDSAIVRLTLNREVVNWRSESLTYLPELEVHLRMPLGDFELRGRLEASYLVSRTFSSSTRLQRFKSQSLLLVNTIELDWDTGLTLATIPIHLMPSVRYMRVEGDAVTALGTRDLFGVQFAVIGDTHGKVPFSSILGVQAGYVFGVHVEAWSVSAVWDF